MVSVALGAPPNLCYRQFPTAPARLSGVHFVYLKDRRPGFQRTPLLWFPSQSVRCTCCR